jgi:hypothetical protein
MLSAKDFLASYQRTDQRQHREQAHLVLETKRHKRKLADVAAGRLVRICYEHPGEEPITGVYLPRVAAFVCKVLGQPQRTARGGARFTLTTQGRMHAAYYPERQADLAVLALLAHARAVTKVERRRRAWVSAQNTTAAQ